MLPAQMKAALSAIRIACATWLAATFLVAPATLHAQDLPAGVALGMTVQQLKQAVAGLAPVPRPARLAGGLVGSWVGPPLQLAGVDLTPTYFFAQGQLRRVDYLAADRQSATAFDALLAWARAAWGQELASQAPEGAYASWTQGELDAYLQQTSVAGRPQVRLVIKRRVLKDAGEL